MEAGRNPRDFTLAMANLALLSPLYPALTRFSDRLREYFSTVLASADFAQNGAGIQSDVNEWISARTGTQLSHLSEQPFPPSASLMLLNGLFFAGQPVEPFNRRLTRSRVFTSADGRRRKVKMMLNRAGSHGIGTMVKGRIKIVQMELAGNLSLVLFLPRHRKGLRALRRASFLPARRL